LLEEGRSPDTPVAAIRWGSRADQRTIVGTLRDIVKKAEEARFEPPTVIVVGEVVQLREQLNWFERRPLFGKRILLTRPRQQAGEFSRLLAAYGAEPVEVPTIEIAPPPSWDGIDRAIGRLAAYQWLIVTSMNAVAPLMDRLRLAGKDARALSHLRICAIGPRTAQELERVGIVPDLIPEVYQAEGLLGALKQTDVQGKKVLIPRAETAREILPDQLRRMGATVDVVPVYRTIAPAASLEALKHEFDACRINVVTFTSSSTVRNFVDLIGGADAVMRMASRAVVACIGPVTAETARECGLRVAIVPPENTVPALADAIVRHFSKANRAAFAVSG
jgi:uroporphyrinogen III methyltransferase/synthase